MGTCTMAPCSLGLEEEADVFLLTQNPTSRLGKRITLGTENRELNLEYE